MVRYYMHRPFGCRCTIQCTFMLVLFRDDGVGFCDDGYIGVNDGEDDGECEEDDAGEDVDDDGDGEDVEDDGDGEDDGYRKNNGASEEDSNEVDGDDEEQDEICFD